MQKVCYEEKRKRGGIPVNTPLVPGGLKIGQ